MGKIIVAVSVFVLFILSAKVHAVGLEKKMPRHEKIYFLAKNIFLGELIDEKKAAVQTSQSEKLREKKFKVIKVWRGSLSPGQNVTLYASVNDVINDKYVVYTYPFREYKEMKVDDNALSALPYDISLGGDKEKRIIEFVSKGKNDLEVSKRFNLFFEKIKKEIEKKCSKLLNEREKNSCLKEVFFWD